MSNVRHKILPFIAMLAMASSAACSTAIGLDELASVEASEAEAVQNPTTEFSTVGKPTKTIETPLGKREVYYPIQDAEVRAAFRRIYDRDEGVIHDQTKAYITQLTEGKLRTVEKPLDVDDRILFNALYHRRFAYNDLGCKALVESKCDSIIRFQENCKFPNGETCHEIYTSRSTPKCGAEYYNRSYHPIGSQFFTLVESRYPTKKSVPEVLGFEAQLRNYFMIKCMKWLN